MHKVENVDPKVSKQAEAKRDCVINLQNYNFHQFLYGKTRQHTFCSVFNFIFIYFCRKAFAEHCDIQIARNYEMKLKIYYMYISFVLIESF